jgi:HEAT repeat protein
VAQGAFRVDVAQALHALTGDEAWAEPIVSVLSASSPFDRLDAAMALAGFTPAAHLIEAVARAVADPEYLVRYHAANTLLRYAALEPSVSDRPEIFQKIIHDDPEQWRAAADMLSAMAHAKRGAGRGRRGW